MDPLAEAYDSQSTYHFSGNNPVFFVDENGMSYSPIYDEEGSVLLQGDAIVINEKDFDQSMSHDDAKSKDKGTDKM